MLIYNTFTKQKEEFTPRNPPRVDLFVCGPTVYSSSHIGHARTYIFFDVIARYLRSQGYDVRYLQNITDIDDKIIHRAKESGIDPLKLSEEETQKYFEDMTSIKISEDITYAPASRYIEEIKAQISKLIETGHAYESNGSVYYDISTFPDFGKLSHQNLEALQKAVRTEDDPNKRHAHDFVLWRGREKDSGEPVWESPWGWGRPGWHIEDTAITEKEFGPQYDIHGGGIELAFPHHEAEIAQMEGASGKHPLVQIWMHTGWVTVKGQKMSKSLGNFLTIQDILKKHSPEALRLLMLQTHYRSPLEYSEELIEGAEKTIKNIKELRARLDLAQKKKAIPTIIESSTVTPKKTIENINESMDNDFGTPSALNYFFSFLNHLHIRLDNKFSNNYEEINKFFDYIENIFGIIPPEVSIPDAIQEKVRYREALRAEKKWKEADAVRDEVTSMGFEIDDTPDGTIVLPL